MNATREAAWRALALTYARARRTAQGTLWRWADQPPTSDDYASADTAIEAMAQAWDEGFATGHDAGVLDEDRPANPYREGS